MIRYFILILVIELFGCKTPTKPINTYSKIGGYKYSVTFKNTKTLSYCGGARPPDQLIEQLNTPQPYANQEYFIKVTKDSFNSDDDIVIMKINTDENGYFNTELPIGMYNIVLPEYKDKKSLEKLLKKYSIKTKERDIMDKECIKYFYKSPIATFKVIPQKSNEVEFNVHIKCNYNIVPCTQYLGPMPN